MGEINSPKETVTDKFLEAAKAGINILPTGSLVSYLLDQIIKPPIQRRTQEWMHQVSVTLNEQKLNIEQLKSNERFVTVFVQASQIAIRNHSEVKLSSLRNSVINSIENPSYPESLQIIFLNYIDRLSDIHLGILSFLDEEGWTTTAGQREFGHGRQHTLENIQAKFEELKGKDFFINWILLDLKNLGLIQVEWDSIASHAMNRAASLPDVTELGKNFLAFIKKK